MNLKIKTCCLAMIMALNSCLDQEKVEPRTKTYTLNGTLVNSEDDTIILYQPHEDPYYQNIKIPVEEGKFSYEFEVDDPVGYDLMYWNNGEPGGRWMTVFLEKSDIELTIYPQDEWDKNKVDGGDINDQFSKYKAIKYERFFAEIVEISNNLNQLQKNGGYYSPSMQNLVKQAGQVEGDELEKVEKHIADLRRENLHISDSAKILIKRNRDLFKELKEWEGEYISKNNDIIAYYLFFTELSFNPGNINLQEGIDYYKKFSSNYPDHPYNTMTEIKLESLANIKPGKKFKDFTLPNLQGEEVSLSQKVRGKKAVINLWSTYCRPCIEKNRGLVPVLEKYDDKGFTVVGVAGEHKNTDRLQRVLDKEEYPWINLVELDNKNFIWEKYGIGRAGGELFLIDEKGIIVAVAPTIEEIKDYLESSIE